MLLVASKGLSRNDERLLRKEPRRHREHGEYQKLLRRRQGRLSVLPPWFDPGDQRLRPYVSCDETQSSDEMAAASEISPASATPATISASFCTLPRP